MYTSSFRRFCLLWVVLLPSIVSAAPTQPRMSHSLRTATGLSGEARRSEPSAQLPRASVIGSFASIGGLITTIAVSETLVLVGKHYGFDLYDTSESTQPILLSHVMVSKVPYDAVFAGSTLFLLEATSPYDFNGKVSIYDIQSPRHPVRLGEFGRFHNAQHLLMNNGRVYVTDYTGLIIFDVSRLDQPKQVGALQNVATQGFADFEVVGDRAYLVEDQGGLWVVDIRDPEHLQVIENYQSGFISSVAIVGTLGYLGKYKPAGDSDKAFDVVDFADPTKPVLRGSIDIGMGKVAQIDTIGTTAFLRMSGGDHDGLLVLDVSRPEAPVRVGARASAAVSSAVAKGRIYLRGVHKS